ncbi:N-acetylmuramoyl-L-alanine amidase [Myxococcota bacterium]|jgi:N-acetylmuramoyl-L-alanine amidase|nr:N-acetylmuramoyl-L-alanine amidase [Myxococcota bacterium]MBU1411699.1 N-acetylmuramoyl-L-alanine amidase [Myxococcota bacterium]MBU1512100.1 N-acetylmuramoyl-L-alanine amidase [Myxococcota bacterium]PKN25901.1 MAG: hypothetical protein CVU65_07290 [Deltaproteobacteria bacterium HGW-Deltaproteobacteria-22]
MFVMAPVWFSLLYLFQPVTILIDAGHGGTNLGAEAVDGTWEKVLTLDLAQRLERALSAYPVRTEMTRRQDVHVGLWRRAEMVRQLRPACFVSLHFNASPLKSRTGLELYFPREDLAKSPGARLRAPADGSLVVEGYLSRMQRETWSIGSRNLARRLAWRLDAAGFRVAQVAPAAFDVITATDTRALLVEGGFIDHEKEGWKILEPAYREQLAVNLARQLATLCMEPVENQITW